ncbi:hypothetical protein HDU97_002593 [Phlyctochytrium planicorne]|nr:hypothetical protein HDU97_002593 [Phlyctochytrium planicorne]
MEKQEVGEKGKKKKGKEESANLRLKVVIRKLPPNLPEAVFLRTVNAWVDAAEWIHYDTGKLAKSAPLKEHVHSRAYIKFNTPDALLDFCKNYNGWLFKEEKSGTSYRAMVEFAPFQKCPKPKKKVDPKMNTLESDPDFLAFVESLNAPEEKLPEPVQTEKPKSTPLLDDLRAKKAQIKSAQEQKRRGGSKKGEKLGGSAKSTPSRRERREKAAAKKSEAKSAVVIKRGGESQEITTSSSVTDNRPQSYKKRGKERKGGADQDTARKAIEERPGSAKSPLKIEKKNGTDKTTTSQASVKEVAVPPPSDFRSYTPMVFVDPSEKSEKKNETSSGSKSKQPPKNEKPPSVAASARPSTPSKGGGGQNQRAPGDNPKSKESQPGSSAGGPPREKRVRKKPSQNAESSGYVPSIVIMKKDGTVMSSGPSDTK